MAGCSSSPPDTLPTSSGPQEDKDPRLEGREPGVRSPKTLGTALQLPPRRLTSTWRRELLVPWRGSSGQARCQLRLSIRESPFAVYN